MKLVRHQRWGAVVLSMAAIGFAVAATAPPAGALPGPTFSATPTSAHVGDVIHVESVTACPPAVEAGDWTSIVNVAQGADDQITFENFLVGQDGSWSGDITLPDGLTPGAAQLTAACFDASHQTSEEVDYDPVDITVLGTTTTTGTPATSTTESTPAPTAAPVAVDPAFTG